MTRIEQAKAAATHSHTGRPLARPPKFGTDGYIYWQAAAPWPSICICLLNEEQLKFWEECDDFVREHYGSTTIWLEELGL